jgi:hypothetical protein
MPATWVSALILNHANITPTKSKIIIKLITITAPQNQGSFMKPPTLNKSRSQPLPGLAVKLRVML